MDDHHTRQNYSCFLDLDDSHGRIGVGSMFSSPSVVSLSKGRPEHCKIYCCFVDMSLCQLLGVLPRVTTLLVIRSVDLPFRGICHMSFFGWSRCFRCQTSLPINSGIPFLPFTFPKFSPLTFVVQCLVQNYFCVLSPPLSRARYSLHPHS